MSSVWVGAGAPVAHALVGTRIRRGVSPPVFFLIKATRSSTPLTLHAHPATTRRLDLDDRVARTRRRGQRRELDEGGRHESTVVCCM